MGLGRWGRCGAARPLLSPHLPVTLAGKASEGRLTFLQPCSDHFLIFCQLFVAFKKMLFIFLCPRFGGFSQDWSGSGTTSSWVHPRCHPALSSARCVLPGSPTAQPVPPARSGAQGRGLSSRLPWTPPPLLLPGPGPILLGLTGPILCPPGPMEGSVEPWLCWCTKNCPAGCCPGLPGLPVPACAPWVPAGAMQALACPQGGLVPELWLSICFRVQEALGCFA